MAKSNRINDLSRGKEDMSRSRPRTIRSTDRQVLGHPSAQIGPFFQLAEVQSNLRLTELFSENIMSSKRDGAYLTMNCLHQV